MWVWIRVAHPSSSWGFCSKHGGSRGNHGGSCWWIGKSRHRLGLAGRLLGVALLSQLLARNLGSLGEQGVFICSFRGPDCLPAAVCAQLLYAPIYFRAPLPHAAGTDENPSRWARATVPHGLTVMAFSGRAVLLHRIPENHIIFTVSSSCWDFPNSSHIQNPAVLLREVAK